MVRTRAPQAFVLAVFAFLAPAVAAADSTPVISAHRTLDVSSLAENSLASIELAVRSGETDVESDTWLTKDGDFVMSHDSPLRAPRCAGPYLDVPLRALSVAQLGEMTCSGEPVARLADVIDAIRPYPAATLRVEVKHAPTDTDAVRTDDAVRLARLLAATGMTGRSILQDFSWATTTAAVRAASPGQRVSALSNDISVASLNSARSLRAYDFSYGQGGSTGFWNQLIADKGLRSTVWTVNDPGRARALRAEGVGTIISDVPSALRAALAAPASQCTLTRYSSNGPMRGGSLAGGARTYRTAPQRSPDGRVFEKALLRVRAWTSSGTASLRIGPQGTPYGSHWEQALTVGSTARTTTMEVERGDSSGVRIRNLSTRATRLEVTVVGGTVYDCR